MVQSKCKQFVGEFMGYDHVEGGPVVDKEHPDVCVLIFQVRGKYGEQQQWRLIWTCWSGMHTPGGPKCLACCSEWASTTLLKHFMMIGVSATGL